MPKGDKVRAEVLGYMGTSYAMQKKFEESYQIFSEAVQIDKEDAYLWFNHSLSCRYTSRSGESLRSMEKAVLLEGDGDMAKEFTKALAFAQKIAESELATRDEGFTLEELIEQQGYFQEGMRLSALGKWEEAEERFRKTIQMGDCLPQPWSNLGIALQMQERFDEAEDAYKRALEIDPKYKNAKKQLKNLKKQRTHPDIKPKFRISSPFDKMKKPSFTIKEE
ncbi:MAG: tetratricopeptide repeat protein [Anaerolineales bacterium]|nr:tetratricopeptide repeat protein [Anaerolineales bacterium]